MDSPELCTVSHGTVNSSDSRGLILHSNEFLCIRNECDQVASELQRKNISAVAYHAGLNDTDRTYYQQSWLRNTFKVNDRLFVDANCLIGLFRLFVQPLRLVWESTSRTSGSSFIIHCLNLWKVIIRRREELAETEKLRTAYCSIAILTLRDCASS